MVMHEVKTIARDIFWKKLFTGSAQAMSSLEKQNDACLQLNSMQSLPGVYDGNNTFYDSHC